jgi:hypothetical protein
MVETIGDEGKVRLKVRVAGIEGKEARIEVTKLKLRGGRLALEEKG